MVNCRFLVGGGCVALRVRALSPFCRNNQHTVSTAWFIVNSFNHRGMCILLVMVLVKTDINLVGIVQFYIEQSTQ